MANASLFAQYSRPVRSVADYTADMDATEANALKLATGRRAVAQADAAAAAAQRSQNKLAQIAAMSATEDDFLAGLDRSGEEGLMKVAQDRRRAAADVGKITAETGAKTADARKTTAEAGAMERLRAIQRITSFERPDVVPGLVQSMVQSGEIEPAEAQAMLRTMPADPAGFERWKYALIQGAAKPDVIVKERGDTERNAATNATSRANNTASNAVTMRGQNMTDARTRELNSSTISKPFEVTGPEGTPILVRQDKAGNISRVDGFGPKAGAAKPLNDTQAKALLFGSRMQEADKVLTALEQGGATRPGTISQSAQAAAGLVPFLGDKLADVAGTATNWTQSADQQSVEQAQRDFVNAVLRRESGAVISQQEFANAAKQYFPAAGDSEQVKAQKAKNRALATRGLMAEVPAGQRGSITQPAQSGGATGGWPLPGSVLKFDAQGNPVPQ